MPLCRPALLFGVLACLFIAALHPGVARAQVSQDSLTQEVGALRADVARLSGSIDLSWDQAFALQAFVEHSTLTVADHARIFSTSADRSYEVLESLGNLYLIEPAGAIRRVGEQLSFTTVTRTEPYRIRPVLQPMVRRLLKARRLPS